MNPYLDEDLQALAQHVRRFATERVAPGFLERDRTRVLDRQLMHVRVPLDHRLGEENQGFVQVMQGFDFSRALIGLQVLAVARVALEETWAYVAQREAFGQPLSAFQGVSHPLAEFDTQVQAARLLCLQALWLKDRGLPHTAEAAMCKWWGRSSPSTWCTSASCASAMAATTAARWSSGCATCRASSLATARRRS